MTEEEKEALRLAEESKKKESEGVKESEDKKSEKTDEEKASELKKAEGLTDTEKRIQQLENDKKALQGQLSDRDKKLNEKFDTEKTLAQQIEQTRNEIKVKDMLMDDDSPDVVKKALKEDSDLTPDNYEAKKEKYLGIFNKAREGLKEDVITDVNKQPDKHGDVEGVQTFRQMVKEGKFKTDEEMIEYAKTHIKSS